MPQLAQATAIVANGGIKHRPHVVLGTRDAVTGQVSPVVRPTSENLGYKPAHVAVVREGLTSVVTSGTAVVVLALVPVQTSAGVHSAVLRSPAPSAMPAAVWIPRTRE